MSTDAAPYQINIIPARKLPPPKLRLATVDDVDELVDLFAEFFGESAYVNYLGFDHEVCRRYLTTAIGSRISPHIVAQYGPCIVGVVSYHIDDAFAAEPLAVMHEMYVVGEWRLSGLGRALTEALFDQAKNVDHATAVHIPITSGHAAMRSMLNMFTKHFGAEQIGVILKKVL